MSVEADPMREDGAGYVILRVSDTGIGISQEDKEHIFERFYRAQNARASIEGNGIGLHLTRSLVTLHHGTIRVYDNEEGQGTTFEVRLPLGNQHLQPEELVPDSVQKIVSTYHPANPEVTLVKDGKYQALVQEISSREDK